MITAQCHINHNYEECIVIYSNIVHELFYDDHDYDSILLYSYYSVHLRMLPTKRFIVP